MSARRPPRRARAGLLFGALLATSLPVGAELPQVQDTAVRAQGPAVVKARTAALLLSGMEGGSLRTALLAVPLPGVEGDEVPVVVVLEVGGAGLLAELGAESAGEGGLEVSVVLYALGGQDEVSGTASHRLILDPSRHREILATSGLRLLTGLRLPPGEHRLRLLVRAGGAFALRSAPLVVPAAQTPLPPPWLPDGEDRWLTALPPAEAEETSPGGVVGALPPPAALPVLTPGRRFTAWLLAPEGMGEETVTARFEAVDGEVVAVAAESAGRRPAGLPQREAVGLAIAAPDLAPGRWTLTLEVAGGRRSSALPVLVAGEGAGPWPRLDAGGSPTAAGEPSPAGGFRPGARTIAGLAPEELRAVYAAALSRLAAGEADGAAAAVEELEQGAVAGLEGERREAALDALEAAQWAVLAELLSGAPDAALPVVLLHDEVAAAHRRRGRPFLAGHCLRLAARLAEAYATASGGEEARRLAARALASLASQLWDAGRAEGARDLFRRALDLDGDAPAALLCLAALEERHGRYREALELLERLVAGEPEHAEGRLRLAINLLRVGETARGRRLLEGLSGGTEPPWVVSLAFQERARLHLAAGECGEAERVLRRALAHSPGKPELGLQLAWALDCQGQGRQARELLAPLLESAPAAAGSDRYRYAHRPRHDLAASRRRLAEEAERRRGVLGRGLAASAGRRAAG